MTATYGDLVGRAGVDIHTGLLHVMRRGFVDAAQAQNTIGVYYDLLAALRSHTWWLIDPSKSRTAELMRAAGADAAGQDLDVVAAILFDSLGPLVQRPVQVPYPDIDFDHPWRDAADRLGAATDLLATHLGPRLDARSEQATQVLDAGQRRGALAFIASLTDVTLNADAAIGAACRHRDVPWEQVAQWLPERTLAKQLVHRMHTLASPYDDGRGLRDVTTNIYPVREGDPLLELADRMLRLRHAAWQLAVSTPDYSVVTLHDLAGLGMAAHLHTAHAHGFDLRTTSTTPNRLIATARAFAALAADLSDYLAPGPPDPGIRVDILAVRELLTDIARMHRPARVLAVSDPAARETLAALHGTCEVLAQVARTNRTTFEALSRSGLIHIPTRLLDGEVLSEDPAAAAAKLSGLRRVVAPPARLARTKAMYEAVDQATGPVPTYAPAPVRAASHESPGLFRASEFEGRP